MILESLIFRCLKKVSFFWSVFLWLEGWGGALNPQPARHIISIHWGYWDLWVRSTCSSSWSGGVEMIFLHVKNMWCRRRQPWCSIPTLCLPGIMFFSMARWDYQPLRKGFTFWDFLSNKIWQPSSSHFLEGPFKRSYKTLTDDEFSTQKNWHPSKNHRSAICSLCAYVVDETKPAIFLFLILHWSRRSMHGWIINLHTHLVVSKVFGMCIPRTLGEKDPISFPAYVLQFFG